MPSTSWGGTGQATGNTSYEFWSTTPAASLPAGRAFGDGWVAAWVTALYARVDAYSGSPSVALALDGVASTGYIGVPGSLAQVGGGCSGWVNGGTATWRLIPSGRIYFDRGGGGVMQSSQGSTWAGFAWGALDYLLCPTPPQTFSIAATATAGQVQVNFAGVADNGGTGVIDYVIEYWDTANPGTIYTSVTTSGLNYISGLTRGRTWSFRVYARNATTNAAGRPGQKTSTASVALPAGGKVWNGSAFVDSLPRIWNGTSWVPATIKVWNGSAFVNAL